MERRGPTVVDASVAAKWFIPEKDTPQALDLRRAHLDGETILVAPALLVYEVTNALRYHPQVGAEALSGHVDDLLSLGLGLDPPSEESLGPAVRLAYRKGVTVYDASYLALAERLDCLIVTADREQLEAAGTRGVALKEWERSTRSH